METENNSEEPPANKYLYFNVFEEEEPLDLLGDVKTSSIWAAGTDLFLSHFHAGLGCSISEKINLIVWVDCPLLLLKKHLSVVEFDTPRVYWPGIESTSRKYRAFKIGGHVFRLSPSFQKFRFKKDENLKLFGLELKCEILPFISETRKIRYLQINYEKACAAKEKLIQLFRTPEVTYEEILKNLKEMDA